MAKKKNSRKAEPELPEVLQDESFVDRNSAPVGDSSAPKVKRVSLKMDENGSIMWDAMSETQKEQIKNAAINDPTILEALAGGGGDSPIGDLGGAGLMPSIPEISSENVKAGLDALMWVQKLVFKKFFKFDKDIAEQVCSFSADQHAELDDRGARIVNKHAPEFLKQYQDEILFCGMLAFYMGLQLQMANNLQEERTKAKKSDAEAKARIIVPRKDLVVEMPQESNQPFASGAD